MAEKDMTEKTLEAYNDVFADIANVLLFQGQNVISEKELEDAVPRSLYKADGKLHEQERDVAKYWKQGVVRIAFCGFENQTEADADMPLRVMSYDGAAYRAQLLREQKKKKGKTRTKKAAARKVQRYPVITLVLYFGYKKHWDQPRKLVDCLSMPQGLEPYVNDYRINLFEIAYLSDEQVASFQSDFRIVADYFVQMRKNNNYVPSKDTITHVHELLQFMSVMTQDNRFEEAYNEDVTEGGNATMCEFLDRIVQEGMERGIEQGRKQGIEQGIEKGIEKGTTRVNVLTGILLSAGRIEDLKRAVSDSVYQEELMRELLPEELQLA